MTAVTIEMAPAAVEFELERLATRYASPRAEVSCAGCFGCSGCSHTGCSGCGSCDAVIPDQ